MPADRAHYRNRQAQFVHSLLGLERAPQGVNSERIKTMQEGLLRKRAATLSRHWPALKRHLGPNWLDDLREHMRVSARSFEDNALRDGLRFAFWVAAKRGLNGESVTELIHASRHLGVRGLFRLGVPQLKQLATSRAPATSAMFPSIDRS